jgi:hypothetical protein
MSQQHEAHQQGATSAAPATWRQRITELQGIDGLKLVPVQGKNPGITGEGWQHRRHDVASILNTPGATGFGLITGYQPSSPSIIAIDFDGPAAVAYAQGLGLDPYIASTWAIARTGADGQPTPDRIKLLFTTTQAQCDRLGPDLSKSLWLTEPPAPGEKGEGVEVFHHHTRQVVVLGDHPSGGQYFWPAGQDLTALAELPDAWFDFVRGVLERIEAGGSKGRSAKGGNHNHKPSSLSSDWRRLGRKEACPICGRLPHSGEAHICAQHRTSGAIRCFDGITFSYNATHGSLKSGDLVQGTDGLVYAFASEREASGIGLRGNFVIHKPRERPALPTTAQPWQQPTTPTTDWMANLPGGNGNGNGNGHSDEAPAAEQVIDAVAVPEGGNAADEAKLIAQLHYLAERILDLGESPAEQWRLPPHLDQFDRIVHAAAALQERRGATSLPAVASTAADLFGIKPNTWRDLVKPKLIEHQQVRAQLRVQANTARATEAVALATHFEGLEPPKGQEYKPLLREMGPGPSDGKRLPVGDLMRRFRDVADARPHALRWNAVSQRVEYTPPGGIASPVPPEAVEVLYTHLAHCGYEVGKQAAIDALVATAKQNTYNPVQEYLNLVADDPSVQAINLGTAASVLLGVDDPLSAVLFAKTLISAVARAMQPGCQVDTILVLKGGQGTGKSRLWRHLIPNREWLVDTTPKDPKDFQLQQHHCWVLELAELEQVTTKREAGELKATITTATDMVRPPYGSSPRPMKRHSVMVATCNRDDFLRDETGSRRFWVIEVDQGRGIDHQAAEIHRDAIWKAATLAWRQGGDHSWWLTPGEALQQEQRNGAFTPQGRFDSLLADWAGALPAGSYFELPTALINSGSVIDRQRCGPVELREAGLALRAIGWQKVRRRIGARGNVFVWCREGETLGHLLPDRPPTAYGY